MISAVRQDTALDYALRVFSLAGLSHALVLARHGHHPGAGGVARLDPADDLRVARPRTSGCTPCSSLLPALAVGYRSSALIMRITRSSLLEVMREDYIRTAWAKGQNERVGDLAPRAQERHPARRHRHRHRVRVPHRRARGHRDGLQPARASRASWSRPSCGGTTRSCRTSSCSSPIVVILSNLAVDMLYGVLDPRVRYGQLDPLGGRACRPASDRPAPAGRVAPCSARFCRKKPLGAAGGVIMLRDRCSPRSSPTQLADPRSHRHRRGEHAWPARAPTTGWAPTTSAATSTRASSTAPASRSSWASPPRCSAPCSAGSSGSCPATSAARPTSSPSGSWTSCRGCPCSCSPS